MGRVKKRHLLKTITIELGLCLAVGLITGLAFLLSFMIPTGGTDPKDICDHVVGTGGLLPFNANEGGGIVYSCNPNWGLVSVYVLGPAAVVSSVLFLVVRFVRLLFYIGSRMRRRSVNHAGAGQPID